MMADALRLMLGGLLAGSFCAFLTARALRTLIFAFAPADYTLLAAAAAILATVAALAAWLPARRAARLNPIDTLR
jgi:ABC-type antimicrobial peptide transport system permease subunit